MSAACRCMAEVAALRGCLKEAQHYSGQGSGLLKEACFKQFRHFWCSMEELDIMYNVGRYRECVYRGYFSSVRMYVIILFSDLYSFSSQDTFHHQTCPLLFRFRRPLLFCIFTAILTSVRPGNWGYYRRCSQPGVCSYTKRCASFERNVVGGLNPMCFGFYFQLTY